MIFSTTMDIMYKLMILCILFISLIGQYLCETPKSYHSKIRIDETLQNPYNFSCPQWSCQYLATLQTSEVWKDNAGYFKQMGCACDELCYFFKDCCEDYNQSSIAVDQKTTIPEQFLNAGLSSSDFSCRKISGIDPTDLIYVIDSCPDDIRWENFTKLCNITDEDSYTHDQFDQFHELSIPVTGLASSAVYRNLYCATCHEESFQRWSIQIKCTSHYQEYLTGKITLSQMVKKPWCTLHYRPPKNISLKKSYRACQPVIDFCRYPKLVPKDVEERCVKGEYLQTVYRHIYYAFKNPFCGMCFVGNMSFIQCVDKLGEPHTKDPYTGPTPFSVLFDVSNGFVETTVKNITIRKQIQCDSSSFFDPFSSRCRTVLCPDDMKFDDGKCVLRIEKNIPTNYTKTQNVSENSNISCTMLEFNSTEYVYNGTHITLHQQDTKLTFEPSKVKITSRGIAICSNEIEAHMPRSRTHMSSTRIIINFSLAEGVVSVCGMCISIIALIFNVIYLVRVKTVRELPNKCILSLTMSLLMANVFLLVASFLTTFPTACKTIAVITHYFFLVVFTWTNVMAIDMYIAFSSLIKTPSRKFVIYSLYAWITPVFIVTIAIILDATHPEHEISPKYGASFCWISCQLSLVVFFAAPLGFILCINFILFVCTARHLHQTQKATETQVGNGSGSSGRHGKRTTVAVYVKLTVIVGLTWALGFLMLLWNSPIIMYAFIVVNSMHGLSVFISCLSNTSVRRRLTSSIIGLRCVLGPQGSNNTSSSETKSSITLGRKNISVTTGSTKA